MSRKESRGCLSLLYVHNPFYLISTCLFVYGLKLLFRSGNTSVFFEAGSVAYMEPWGLMASLAGVTTLMCVTAILIVRFGKVWEDARSLVLIVLLMILAIAVSFDELITVLSDRDNSRRHLFTMIGVSVAFAAAVTELLLRGLRVRLPAAYRLPLFGFMLLFFLWPLSLLTEVTGLTANQTRWLIVGFPVAAAVLTMTLLPAIRQGAAAVKDNGTPWSWPLFPWTPFVFIALAVCFRSYSLTMSYDPIIASGHYWDTIFGLYQLVPFVLAVQFLLLQMGLTENLKKLTNGVLLSAPAVLVLAYPWIAPWSGLSAYTQFTYTVVQEIASPVFVAMIGLAMIYGWAWYKGIRSAELGFSGMVFLCTVIGPHAFGYRQWSLRSAEVSVWPVLILAGLNVFVGLRSRHSGRLVFGCVMAASISWFATGQIPDAAPWRLFAVIHLAFLVMLTVGVFFKDDLSGVCRELGPFALFCLTIFGCFLLFRRQVDPSWLGGYPLAMVALAVLLGRLLPDDGYLPVAYAEAAMAGAAGLAYAGYVFFTANLVAGVKQIVLAIICFLGGVFISILKAGLSRRIRMSFIRRKRLVDR